MNHIEYMKEKQVKSVLDIGANVGSFSLGIKTFLPDIDIFMIEGNPFCDAELKNKNIPYTIACLSDSEKFIKMHINKNNIRCTGTSYYKETTHHYDDADYINVNAKLLDNIIHETFGEYKQFDYVKMDTQGSELDIIRGGRKTIDQAKYIQIELSLIEYNKGAPLKNDVISFMESIGFKQDILINKHHWDQDPSKDCIQEDWIFTR